VRGPKSAPVEGEHELFGFLTTEAKVIVAPIHPKAMPVSYRCDGLLARFVIPSSVGRYWSGKPLLPKPGKRYGANSPKWLPSFDWPNPAMASCRSRPNM
jgi:hypothetical protein